MKNNIKAASALILALVLIILSALPCFADSEGSAKTLAEGILQYKLGESGSTTLQEFADGYLCENAGSTAEWYAYTLALLT